MEAMPPIYSPEEGYLDPNITIPAQRLARSFAGRFAGFSGHRLRAAAGSVMQMLLDEGVSEPVLTAEILNPARPRDQKLWDFPVWVRARAAEVAETTGPDGEVKLFDATWAWFRREFVARFVPANQQAPYLADWKEDCRRRLGEETTDQELAGALAEWSVDPRRSEPKQSSMFWPRNAWPYLAEKVLSNRKRKRPQRIDHKGQPAPERVPVGYSLVEAARRVQEAKRCDPGASAAEVIAAYKRELEER